MKLNQKFYRYIFYERTFKIFLLVFLLLCIVLVFQLHVMHTKQKILQMVKSQQQLVDQIPMLERELDAKLRALVKPAVPEPLVDEEPPPAPVVEEKLVLEGVVSKKGTAYAIINDDLYRAGDIISKYIIINIDITQVKLKDLRSKTMKVLKVNDFDVQSFEAKEPDIITDPIQLFQE